MTRVYLCAISSLLLVVMALAGCAVRQPTFDSLTVGFSTPKGNRIWVREAEFDRKWSVPVGNLACCWEESGAPAIVFDRPMPQALRVRRDDESRGVIYEAQTQLPEDLGQRARELPPVTRHANGEVRKDQYLIIGLRDDGSMVVWLSNSGHPRGIDGHVLNTVARADGRIVRDMP